MLFLDKIHFLLNGFVVVLWKKHCLWKAVYYPVSERGFCICDKHNSNVFMATCSQWWYLTQP